MSATLKFLMITITCFAVGGEGCRMLRPNVPRNVLMRQEDETLHTQRKSLYFHAALKASQLEKSPHIMILGLWIMSDGVPVLDTVLLGELFNNARKEWSSLRESLTKSGQEISEEDACRIYILSRFLDSNREVPQAQKMTDEIVLTVTEKLSKILDSESRSTDTIQIAKYSVESLRKDDSRNQVSEASIILDTLSMIDHASDNHVDNKFPEYRFMLHAIRLDILNRHQQAPQANSQEWVHPTSPLTEVYPINLDYKRGPVEDDLYMEIFSSMADARIISIKEETH